MLWYVITFLGSCFLIILASQRIIDALHRLTQRLGWKEFVTAFFSVSVGAVLPELFIGGRAALKGVPELALGSVLGQNMVLFTLSVAICTFLLKEIVVESRTVRAGTTFALITVILPFLLLLNGQIGRIDGIILIAACFVYIRWLFSKKDYFLKEFDKLPGHGSVLKDSAIIFSGFLFIVLAAEGITFSAEGISSALAIPVTAFGVFAVGLGVALPETFFTVALARRKHSWMILGGLMGAIALSSTLVLGIVALINPIVITDFSPLYVLRFFLVAGGIILLFFVRTQNKITRREALFLFFIYFLFLLFEFIII